MDSKFFRWPFERNRASAKRRVSGATGLARKDTASSHGRRQLRPPRLHRRGGCAKSPAWFPAGVIPAAGNGTIPGMRKKAPISRRRFLGTLPAAGAGLAAAGRRAEGTEGSSVQTPGTVEGKSGLRVLSDRPVNAETPVPSLDPRETPNDKHFVRNNGGLPERALSGDLTGWALDVNGEVESELRLGLDDIRSGFENVTASLVLECAGNGRAAFRPPVAGNAWWVGAVGCARYTGVRLRDVLLAAGPGPNAVYVAWYGEDPHLSGDPAEVPISRGLPLSKAMDESTLLAWEMNGEPLPPHHGFPLRIVAPGYPASASGKWLSRIWVRDRVHDGPKMTGFSYRVPRYPVAPGADVPEEDMEIIGDMPVKSLITRPASGIQHPAATPLPVRGWAWAGGGPVTAVHVSADFGANWIEARLEEPQNRFAWQRFEASVAFDIAGHYEIWARATDHRGATQPMVVPGWNPRGYLNNAAHRIAVTAV